jgi:hypothetical protein
MGEPSAAEVSIPNILAPRKTRGRLSNFHRVPSSKIGNLQTRLGCAIHFGHRALSPKHSYEIQGVGHRARNGAVISSFQEKKC